MNTGISSHVEGYVKIATRATIKRRNKDRNNETKCRLCKNQEETVFHVLGSCSSLSSNLYLTTRHDNIARELVREIANVEKPKKQRGPFPVMSHTATQEIWWNHPVPTFNKVKHNHPDIIIWDKQDMKCTVIDILCLIPILVGSSVATVCPPERDNALRTAVTTVTRVPL